MRAWLERRSLTAWAGLFVGAAAWFLDHQVGSDTVIWRCQLGGPLFIGVLGLVCGLLAFGGGLLSWRARTPPPGVEDPPQSHSFAGAVGVGSAGLFLLAIAFQTLNGFIVPVCER